MTKINVDKFQPEEKQHFYHGLIDEMTKGERRILGVLVECEKKVLAKEWTEITPKRSTLAKIARVSESSVRNFIKKYEGIVFTHETRKKSGSYKHNSNKYFINPDLRDVVIMLQACNYYHRWDEKRNEVKEGLMSDDFFLCSKTLKFYELSTTKLPTAILLNLPAIKSYMNSYIYKRRNTDALSGGIQNSVHKKEERDEIFGDIPLTYAQKTRLAEYNAIVDLKEARKQHDKYVYTWGQKVISPYFFVKRQAEKNYAIRNRRK